MTLLFVAETSICDAGTHYGRHETALPPNESRKDGETCAN